MMDDQLATVCRRFMARPGYRLINGRQVFLPLHSVAIRVFVVEKRPVPVIEEFLLKLISKAVRRPGELAGLLGVEPRIIHNRLVGLRRDELIDIEGAAGAEPECHLTRKGVALAHNLVQERMKEITLPNVMFHTLLKKPVSIGTASAQRFLRERDLPEDPPAIRIQPNGVAVPTEECFSVTDLNRVIDHSPLMRREHASIAAVRGIIDKGGLFFEPAVMLEYQSRGETHNPSVRFVVDGVLNDEYEQAFANANGYEVCRHLLSPHEESLRERLSRNTSPAIISSLGDIEAAEEIGDQIAAAEQELTDTLEAANAAREEFRNANPPQEQTTSSERADTRQVLRDQLAQANAIIAAGEEAKRSFESKEHDLRKQIEMLRERQSAMKVQRLWTTEIRVKFDEAIRTAKERLLIISAFISSDVVNDAFVSKLDRLLKNGCQIWIGYGMEANTPQQKAERSRPAWTDAEDRLLELAERHGARCVVRDLNGSHVKRVICDTRFTIGGSFNYLSFRGEVGRGGRLRQEESELIVDPQYCQSLYDVYLKNRLYFG